MACLDALTPQADRSGLASRSRSEKPPAFTPDESLIRRRSAGLAVLRQNARIDI
jgi:hypothetical protein